ncbi:MAG TPA: prepilin peptidase [Azospirillum sp.]|nr:prepilin peptidase [Azospirillum sp.]
MASVHALLLAWYVVPVALAMGWDAVSYRIPNWAVLLLIAGFPVAGLLAPGGVPWLWHLAAAAVVFGAGLGLFALRLAGGGDVKLLTAVALWAGWEHLAELAILMGVLGGVVVVLLLLGRAVLARTAMTPPRLLRAGEPVPYGLAIGLAALILAPELGVLGR